MKDNRHIRTMTTRDDAELASYLEGVDDARARVIDAQADLARTTAAAVFAIASAIDAGHLPADALTINRAVIARHRTRSRMDRDRHGDPV